MNIHESIENIKKGRDLDKNLPYFATAMSDSFLVHGANELSFNFVMLYQSVEALEDNKNEKKLLSELNDIVKKGILSEFDGAKREDCVKKALELRNVVEDRHDKLSVIMSYFDLYRYILTRKVKREEIQAEPDDAARKVLRYIFDTNDNNVINTKIQSVISELPVRYTRVKFYEIVDDALNKYVGGEKSALDTFAFLIRRWGTLDAKDEAFSMYPEYAKVSESIISDMDSVEAEKLLTRCVSESRKAIKVSNIQELFANSLNSLITVLLVTPYAMNADTKDAYEVIRITSGAVDDESTDKEKYEEEIAEALGKLEGLEESMYHEHSRLSAALDDIVGNYMGDAENVMAGTEMKDLAMCLALNSGNLFAPLEKTGESKTITDSDIYKVKEELHADFKSRFENTDVAERRAVMASVLGILPVYFNNRSEVMEYIRSSLSYINDEDEYAGSIAALNELITE